MGAPGGIGTAKFGLETGQSGLCCPGQEGEGALKAEVGPKTQQ